MLTTETAHSRTPTLNSREWTPLRVYSTYRVFLALLLQTIFWFSWPSPLVGQNNPTVFFYTVTVYTGLTILWPAFWRHSIAGISIASPMVALLTDTLVLSILIHASGGITSTLNVLLVVTSATASILLPGPKGYLIAALATFSVIFEQFYFSLQAITGNPFHLTESGLLGLSFFIVALIIQKISQRLVQSENLALKQEKAIRQLEQLNQQIVERMLTGILVFNQELRILVANQAAKEQLGLTKAIHYYPSLLEHEVTRKIAEQYRLWKQNPVLFREAIGNQPGKTSFNISFATMENTDENLVLAFLEDHSRIAHEAQQLKLASLGRLSATIAHEIRNPLSAIHHATDLLDETRSSEEDRQLLNIIQRHVGRVNSIIEDILSISRRPKNAAVQIDIQALFEQVLQHAIMDYPDLTIGVNYNDKVTQIYFDPEQLKQVINNLIRNTALHAGKDAHLEITINQHGETGIPFIRFEDNGPGIPDETAKNLFEPFFTTSNHGTGLGLYLCKEICESNHARLDFEPTDSGACFVITLAHPKRNI